MKTVARHVARTVFGRLLPRAAYPVVSGPLRGARFILGSLAGEGGGATVYFGAVEPEQTAAFVEALSPGQVFFDIGANVGYYTILGSRLVGSQGFVVAIEPSVRNLSFLYRHVDLNGASNVTILAAACADEISFAGFCSGTNHATGSLTSDPAGGNIDGDGEITFVSTVTVDSVVQKLGVIPDVIKIDVEGAELSVLKGAHATLLRKRPTIFLSVHSDDLRSLCLGYLEGLGYTTRSVKGDKDDLTEFVALHSGT